MTVGDRVTVFHHAYFPDLRFGTQIRVIHDGGSRVEAGIVAMVPLK
jgi:hypothetical protein